MRNKAEKRHNDRVKEARRRRIISAKFWWIDGLTVEPRRLNTFRFSDRLHKTNNNGSKKRYLPGNYAPYKNWSYADRQRRAMMDSQESDYYAGLAE